jgi:hypothetical protein
MRARAPVLVLALIACSGSGHGSRTPTDTALVRSLTGAWDASLSLSRPYSLGLALPAAGRICGTIGFVENRSQSAADQYGAESFGVYDLDLRRIGLDWLGDNSFPEAVASSSRRAESGPMSTESDSVTIVLNPGSSERIVLVGQHHQVGIDGRWVAQSARGTASGSFSLRPHAGTQRSC